MAKFTKSTEKKGAAKNGAVDKVLAKSVGGVVKKTKQQKPAVAPAAAKPTAAVKAAIVADAKPKKVAQQPKEKKEKTVKTGTTVFVGNLPTNIKRKAVIGIFKPFGEASSLRFRRNNGAKLFKTDLASQPSIIAFVDLPTAAEARAAVAGLNGTNVGDNVLRVDLQAGSKNAGKTDAKRTAFIGNLSYKTTDNQLRKAFESCGKIDYVRLNQTKKGCDGTAFVCFKDGASVVAALKLNGQDVNGRPVRVNRSEKKQAEAAAAKPVKEEEEDEDEDEEEIDAAEDDSEDEEEDEIPAPVVAKKSAKPAPKAAAPKAAAAPKKAAAASPKAGGNKKKAGKKVSA